MINETGCLFRSEDFGAKFSPDRVYRYSLIREWDSSLPRVAFCMLNPSTADEVQNDPTIRRCLAFARSWGYGRLEIVNLFAYRSTDRTVLGMVADPIGVSNNLAIYDACVNAREVVCAWGTWGAILDRGAEVKKLIPEEKRRCIRLTKEGHPEHPLYLPGDLKPMRWL